MKINSIVPNQIEPSKTCSNLKPNFTSNYGTQAFKIEKALANKNISCEFNNNNFVAECAQKSVKMFSELFGEKFLPKRIEFKDLCDYNYGECSLNGELININSALPCFNSKEELTEEMGKAKNIFFLPDDKSTTHYLRTFIHELGHCVHVNNLKVRNLDFMADKLQRTKIPSSVGRLITKFKLGEYSAQNMDEFMAERIAKDISKNLNTNDEYVGSILDVRYSDMFERKWNCRYITPQSYIDYFTQQVWNGDIEGAEKVAIKMKDYLEALQIAEYAQKVERPVITTTLKVIERQKESSTLKQDSLLGKIDTFLGKLFSTPNYLEKIMI